MSILVYFWNCADSFLHHWHTSLTGISCWVCLMHILFLHYISSSITRYMLSADHFTYEDRKNILRPPFIIIINSEVRSVFKVRRWNNNIRCMLDCFLKKNNISNIPPGLSTQCIFFLRRNGLLRPMAKWYVAFNFGQIGCGKTFYMYSALW